MFSVSTPSSIIIAGIAAGDDSLPHEVEPNEAFTSEALRGYRQHFPALRVGLGVSQCRRARSITAMSYSANVMTGLVATNPAFAVIV